MNALDKPIDRRRWLKISALLAGSVSLMYAPVKAGHRKPPQFRRVQQLEHELAQAAPPTLKARLFANENPWGPCPASKKALTDAVESGNRYPMREGYALSEQLAKMEGVETQYLLPSAGSSGLLATLGAIMAMQGGNMVSSELSYEHMPESAESLGMKVKRVPLRADYSLDLEAMARAVDRDTRAVYICNPNNPTGSRLDPQELRAFCREQSKRIPIVVDEAYLHYQGNDAENSMTDLIAEGVNVVVLRTFSKLFGFAGIRMGYALAQPAMLEKIWAGSAAPYGVSSLSIAAAKVALAEHNFHRDVLAKTQASKDFLYQTLEQEGYTYLPSSTNFVLFPIQMDGERFTEEMMKRGVGVRYWEHGGQQWCRVSLGRMDEMEAFADAFKQLS